MSLVIEIVLSEFYRFDEQTAKRVASFPTGQRSINPVSHASTPEAIERYEFTCRTHASLQHPALKVLKAILSSFNPSAIFERSV